MTALFQVQGGMDAVEKAIDAAPVLAISLLVSVGGMFFIARLFLGSYQRTEEQRARVMDERHRTYFSQLDTMNQATIQAMDRGTEALRDATESQRESTKVLGGVQELMRDLKRAPLP